MIGRRSVSRPPGLNLTQWLCPQSPVVSNICSGPDGRLWFTTEGITQPYIGAMDTLGNFTQINAGATGNGFGGICTDGTYIYAADTGNNTVYQVNPTTNTIANSAVVTGANGLAGIVYGPDGKLYVASTTAHTIIQFTTALTGFTSFTLPNLGTPHGLNTGPDGAGNTVLWFCDTAHNTVLYMTTAGVFTTITPQPNVVTGAYYATASGDGNVWFTDRTGSHIIRIRLPATADGNTMDVWSPPTASSQPGGLWPDGLGNLWFCEENTNKLAYLPLTSSKPFHTSAIVQTAANYATASTVTATNFTTGPNSGTATAGNLLVAFVASRTSVTTFNAPTDNIGGTWTQQGSQVNNTNCSAAVFTKVAAGGEKTFTATSGGTTISAVFYEIHGQVSSSPVDGTPASSTAATATTITTGSVTPTTGNSLILSTLATNGTKALANTWTNGWVSDGYQNNDAPNPSHEWASLVTTATTALTTTETWTSTGNAVTLTIVIKLNGAPAALTSPITELALPSGALPDKICSHVDGNMYYTVHNSPGQIGRAQLA